ncbi:hypothetical protein [Streptomyces sp. NPDC089795]|uniref:hypothetical protein n=1 Tax=Streptomyces sp. NPDC089795 TaxID=3155297 RepID=UPI0034409B77
MSHTVLPRTPLPRTGPAPAPRGRIGAGFSPVPHRYHLYLRVGCPHSLRVTDTLTELRLARSITTTVLGTDPRAAEYTALRLAYEAAGHHFDGTLTVPALVDGWSGRVVSDHTPDILDDLRLLATHPAFRASA